MSCDFYSLLHPSVRSLHPYIPGKSIEEVAREHGITDIIKLASNENPLGCSPNVMRALHKLSSQTISRYPSSIEHPLRQKLAEHLSVDKNGVILSNGSDLLFCLLLTAFAMHDNKHIITHDLAFISYKIQAQTLNIPVVSTPLLTNWQVDIDTMINTCNKKTALIFIANPNNPTGISIEQGQIQKLLENIPQSTLLVLDEAYYEYHEQTSIALLEKFPNLIITRTFSKAYGMAGLRLGYGIAHPHIVDILYRLQLPFAVNQAAMVAGIAALEDQAFIKKTVTTNKQGQQQMELGLNQLNIPFLPSTANFITIDGLTDAIALNQALLQSGIIVRPLHPAYELKNYLRVTIGTKQQNKRFLEQLSILKRS